LYLRVRSLLYLVAADILMGRILLPQQAALVTVTCAPFAPDVLGLLYAAAAEYTPQVSERLVEQQRLVSEQQRLAADQQQQHRAAVAAAAAQPPVQLGGSKLAAPPVRVATAVAPL
jgi:hypothetical protein